MIRAFKPCSHSGCHVATTDRFCPAHVDDAKAWQHSFKQSAAERGYGWLWVKIRRRILKRDPVCKICGIRPSTDCDHIVPKSRGGKDSDNNLQGLCKGCHKEKTTREKQA